jgi:hypothetical protein
MSVGGDVQIVVGSSEAENEMDPQKKLKEQKRLEKLAKFEAKKAKTLQQKEPKDVDVEVCILRLLKLILTSGWGCTISRVTEQGYSY